MKLRLFNHLFLGYHYKLRKCYGVSSKVKGSQDHFLLFDIDTDFLSKEIEEWFKDRYGPFQKIWYKTHNGYHCIVFKECEWRKCLQELIDCPYVDIEWVALGIKRGYFFLETYTIVDEPKLTYMEVDRLT